MLNIGETAIRNSRMRRYNASGIFHLPVALNLSSGFVRCDTEKPANRLAFLPALHQSTLFLHLRPAAIAEVRAQHFSGRCAGIIIRISDSTGHQMSVCYDQTCAG